jgi:ADP-ribosylglycohydrolase
MATRADRVAGCLVGLAVGDALGAPLEFLGRHEDPQSLSA